MARMIEYSGLKREAKSRGHQDNRVSTFVVVGGGGVNGAYITITVRVVAEFCLQPRTQPRTYAVNSIKILVNTLGLPIRVMSKDYVCNIQNKA